MYDVWVDGSQNHGGIGVGVVVYKGSKRVYTLGCRELRKGSNNVAEYLAVNVALRWLLKHNAEGTKIILHTDSTMVANQMNGTMVLKGGAYIEEALKARALRNQFSNLTVIWIPRERNQEADALSKI
jgi:ribonuclease HI